jgi:hypothetical protein
VLLISDAAGPRNSLPRAENPARTQSIDVRKIAVQVESDQIRGKQSTAWDSYDQIDISRYTMDVRSNARIQITDRPVLHRSSPRIYGPDQPSSGN